MTDSEKETWKKQIDKMGQMEMAGLWRNAPVGHPVFDRRNGLFEYFDKRFKSLGGMTPSVSKALG